VKMWVKILGENVGENKQKRRPSESDLAL